MKGTKDHSTLFDADRAYRANAEELRGIDRGLRDSAEGKFASPDDVKATFARYRPLTTCKQN
jgi:predicted transcriptional regulator